MIKRKLTVGAAVMGLTLGLLVVLAGPASAHEERTVGKYHVEVGFGQEPPYAGYLNSVQLILTDAGTGKPVTDLGDTLKVTVKTGDQTMDLSIEPNFELGGDGQPGDYRAWFIPTTPGTYSFQFSGTIKGQTFDQAFTSGQSTFDDVNDPASAQFPLKEPNPAQISQRLDRESARQATALAATASKARDEANSARVFGIVGVVVGVLGLAVGSIALVTTRRKPATVPPSRSEVTAGTTDRS